jgi:hypothetical protein
MELTLMIVPLLRATMPPSTARVPYSTPFSSTSTSYDIPAASRSCSGPILMKPALFTRHSVGPWTASAARIAASNAA